MEVHEFGKENSQKIVLIPGNMMCWRQFEPVIPLLEQKYHIIAISTDGYDGSGKTTFTTAEALILYDEIDRFTPRSDAKVSIWHGEKEPNMKKAIRKLKRAFPNAEDHPFAGYGHGEIMSHPDLMMADIVRFMENRR